MMKTERYSIVLLLICLSCSLNAQQWWSVSDGSPTCKANTCRKGDTICECSLTIEHRLTMMNGFDPVVPFNGKLYKYNDASKSFPIMNTSKIITADGNKSRLVIAVNGKFPGPTIEAQEDQLIIVHVKNLMHTDSTTIHWHGMHQSGTPYSDGVAFISQCPILPGQTYTYRFKGKPHGTSFYHAHIGDQRSMGLYGGLIIYPENDFSSSPQEGFVVLLQDWNHDDDPETLYQRMINGVYKYSNNQYSKVESTQSVDGANFSRFQFHSGLINGKGRYYTCSKNNNGAPLEVFEVEQRSQPYRFRVISAATLYPFRVYIQGHRRLDIVASDGFEIQHDIYVESFIIHPGERYDFKVSMDEEPGSYLLVAETLEVLSSSRNEYHAAEAIIKYKGAADIYPPKFGGNICLQSTICRTFNCPYLFYPKKSNRTCIPYDAARSNEPKSKFKGVTKVDETLFFNFAFPGTPGNTPGSVNGHQFIPPTSPILTQPDNLETPCDESKCSTNDSICECTYSVTLESDKVYQFVITNIGKGRGWSHPVHLHGHYFYVMKMGFGTYNSTTAKFLTETADIECTDNKNYCNSETWRNDSWNDPDNIPGIITEKAPEKDTIIVPTGGYVVIRFKADNPGAWFFHCHIDLHNTNGMGMVLLESPNRYPKRPQSFETCENHNDDGKTAGGATEIDTPKGILTFILVMCAIVQRLVLPV